MQSINASGHKYGLVYPGVGWVVWRNPEALPDDLVFHVNYLGGDMPTFALNFSRPGNHVVAQYYNFVRLGFEGYRARAAGVRATWRCTSRRRSAKMDAFRLLTDGSELPVFAFRSPTASTTFTVFDVSRACCARSGWLVPAYTFPENRQDLAVLRIVVRNGFDRDLADLLIADIAGAADYLSQLATPLPPDPAPHNFHH